MRRRALWHASIGVRGHLNSHCSGQARALGSVHDGSWALTSPTIVCIARLAGSVDVRMEMEKMLHGPRENLDAYHARMTLFTKWLAQGSR